MISTHENSGSNAPGDITLEHIQSLAAEFAGRHTHVTEIVKHINREIEAIKNKHLPTLKRAVGHASASKLTLHTAIAGAPQLFKSPRTVIFHGIKVGLQKGKGGIEFDDAEKVVALIRKHFPEDIAPAYIRTVEVPDKKMLTELKVSDLKKIGCNVGDTSDQVVIKPADSDVEKTVAVLLKDAVQSEA